MESDRKKFPETEAIVMDLIPVHAEVVAFVKEGVAGFIPKDATLDHFLHTIRSVAKGIKVLPSPSTGSLFSQIVEHAIRSRNTDQIVKSVRMTKREQEVIDLIAQGRSNKEIAAKLCIAVHTVKNHVHNIIGKLALHIRLVLTHHARKGGETDESS
jgi:DNA-binding NarL/FixJ family response regulator